MKLLVGQTGPFHAMRHGRRLDGPALDYVRRYPPPADDDDDPGSQAFAAGPWGAGRRGPDLHAACDAASGGARGGTVLDTLRQRALSGSSEDEGDDDERWRSMDIPALLLSPHHASALRSLSSSDEDVSGVPDFADLNLAREADAAGAAAAELVPPELQPVARAANILGYHAARGRAALPVAADEPPLHLQANRFQGMSEPLTPQQLQAAAMLMNNIAPASGLSFAFTAGSGDADSAGPDATEDAAMIGGVPPSRTMAGLGQRSGLRRSGARAGDPRLKAAAAAAVAEEGVEWLSRGPAATAAPQRGHEREEDRSVQLRRAPHPEAAERGMDPLFRTRISAQLAEAAREADAHVVKHGAPTAGSEPKERFILPTPATSTAVAAEKAKAAAAEARQAVWGEGGWPYGSAMCSADVVEDLKTSIHQIQDEADHGSSKTLLP
ncbi:hypothetical protein GPECTOR_1g81 [Gonium pectorale]|uniref:Uncharacterized protein n=1 Tax=Gonium pectorale TaxID=33097 RepID=A0A150H4X5_GONPE|nr:hypothetical protein GPECTOR_1g81 [Gonium pectorale]|eukprot:KXZ56898.1 hypothetical protein GPECTOR_1g81 [Gonium pectorale]